MCLVCLFGVLLFWDVVLKLGWCCHFVGVVRCYFGGVVFRGCFSLINNGVVMFWGIAMERVLLFLRCCYVLECCFD